MSQWLRSGLVTVALVVAVLGSCADGTETVPEDPHSSTTGQGASGAAGGDGGAGGAGATGGSAAGGATGGGGEGGGCSRPPQTDGDCSENVCQGDEVVAVPDPTDVLDDVLDCTIDSCMGTRPINTPAPAGTACSQNGGKTCDGEGDCVECADAGDCAAAEVCNPAGSCVPASCADGVQSGDETDVDCGGSCGPTCQTGDACLDAADCESEVCSANVCQAPSCSDAVQNGDETDIDCGGSCAQGCGPNQGCVLDTDCEGADCSGTICVPNCFDGVANAGETDVDCGGACSPCNNGQLCFQDVDCGSGFCVAGICCNTACAGVCLSCAAASKASGPDGTCGPVPVGLPCGDVASCVNGVMTFPDTCNAGGVCADAGTQSCGPYACGPTQCNAFCTTNLECAAGSVCVNSQCQLAPTGSPCATDAQCASSHCVDSVCCATACGAACQACSAIKKGSGADGTCGNIAAGSDPDNECAGATNCNGLGSCTKLANGAACSVAGECTSNFCVDGVCCNSACGALCNACSAALKGTGADGACGVIASGLDPEAECPGTAVCDVGVCKQPIGAACAAPAECIGAQCVDGVCCNSACTASCQACTAAKKGSGADGACGTIANGSDPDDECVGASSCNGSGACSKLANGAPCSVAAECTSNFCVDGVCCNLACGAVCQACSAAKKGSPPDGTCGNVGIGSDPDNECAGAIACNGAGACATLPNGATCSVGAECATGFCVDGVCCNSSCTTLCNACSAAKKGTGADGTCGTIASGLDPDNECSGASICNGASLCKLPLGQSCLLASDCASGFCADGVCCSAACTGACQACTAAKKGSGADGACGNVGAGTDPDNECSGAINCSGAGACATLVNGAACSANGECASNFCVDGVCCNSICNTLCNACTAVKKGSGVDGTCAAISGGLDPDNECAGVQVCNGASLCKLPNGEACIVVSDCVSNFCTDGVCCNAACNGACQACTAAKKGSGPDGACGNVAAFTDPDNECFGAITCNGAGACASLANGAACSANGECSSGFCVDGVCCNTACNTLCNACSAVKKGSGADGACGAVGANLDPDNECAGAQVCNGASLCKLPNGAACALGSDCVSNACADGVCCNTTCTGSCQACTAAKKGSGLDGVCGSIAASTDPDNECFGSITCNGAGACSTLANGNPCSANAECASTFCVDGFCCNTSCTTLCQACSAAKKNGGANGTCGTIPNGNDPDSECPGVTLCSGASTCSLLANGAACSLNGECSSGSCVDGVCCNTPCTGTCQACSAAKKGSGANGTCGQIATSTDPDAECPGATTCNAVGACGLFANGVACSLDGECTSGSCVDGVCCNTACGSLCQACIGAKTNVSDGTCADVVPGTDPDDECSDLTSTPNCGGSLMCGP